VNAERTLQREAFCTEDGILVPAVTAAQMREVDRVAVEETGPNLFQMMENAGRSLAATAIEMLGARSQEARILVLAGKGGNGGGGICAARHLANRGIQVALCMAEPLALSDVAKWQYRVFTATPGRTVSAAQVGGESFDLIIDSLIGYSLAGAPSGIYAALIDWANAATAKLLALDIPSGLDSTTGTANGPVIRTDVTMTLALPKTGLASGKAGELLLADIGIPAETYRRLDLDHVPPFGRRYVVPLHRRNGATP
jgi:NAD(P)H-hydrate epimerase